MPITEKQRAYLKEYRKKNKEIIAQKRNTKVNCECGGKYTLASKARHFRLMKHINYCTKIKEEPTN